MKGMYACISAHMQIVSTRYLYHSGSLVDSLDMALLELISGKEICLFYRFCPDFPLDA
jgi:hypothetical protein